MQIEYQHIESFGIIQEVPVVIHAGIIHEKLNLVGMFHTESVQVGSGVLSTKIHTHRHGLDMEITLKFFGFLHQFILYVADYYHIIATFRQFSGKTETDARAGTGNQSEGSSHTKKQILML